MKTILFLFAALTLLTLKSCQTDKPESAEDDDRQANTEQETPVKLIEYLVGEWEEIDGSTGGSGIAQGNPGQRLTFTTEARYIAHEGNQKVDSGAYRMNEHCRIFIWKVKSIKVPGNMK